MKKLKTSVKLMYVLLCVLILACNTDDDQPTPDDSGYLSMNVSISVESESASGRTTTGNVDDFFVAVFDINDVLIVSYENLSEAPPEIELITGEYYVVAHSDNQEDAAFDNPYYYGRSDNFTIDKEELKSVDIVAELANSKVSFHYSNNVISTFDSYSSSVEVVSSGAQLNYIQGETREGYFLPEPLSVEVNLSYTKLDGSFITRTFTTTIDAQPKTLYKVMVDASLQDGQIVFNLIVDDSFEEEVIGLGASGTFNLVLGTQNDSYLWDAAFTLDGGYILVGTSQNNFYVVKADQSGNLIWENEYGGSRRDECLAVESTDDGGYVLVGMASSNDGDVSQNQNNSSGWVVKIDSDGQILWEKTFGLADNRFSDVEVSQDGSIFISGVAGPCCSGWILKLSSSGVLIWEKEFPHSSFSTSFEGLTLTQDGGFIAVGRLNIGQYVLKGDSEGNREWDFINGVGSSYDYAHSVVEVSDGYLIAGSTESNNEYDGYLMKIDNSGNLLWDHSYGGSGFDVFFDLNVASNNDVILTGVTLSNDLDAINNPYFRSIWIARVDANGNRLSDYFYEGVEGHWIEEDASGFLNIGATGGWNTLNPSARFSIIKTNPDGTP